MGKPACFYWNKVSSWTVHCVEKCFYNLGVLIAIHPWRTIGLCGMLVGLSSLGLLNFYQEKDPMKLWVPPDSDFYADTDWLINTFKIGYRAEFLLVTAPNVLDPVVLTGLARINQQVLDITAQVDNEEYKYNDVCFKLPIIKDQLFSLRKRRSVFSNFSSFFNDIPSVFDQYYSSIKNETQKPFEPSVDLVPEFYCELIKGFESGCVQRSILDLWRYDVHLISKLEISDVIEKLNSTKVSPVSGHSVDYVSSLSGIERDAEGKIVSAKSAILIWLVHVNFTSTDVDVTGNEAGTESWVSASALAWEKKFLDLMASVSKNVSDFKIFYEAGRSYGDISANTMFQDIDKLILGIGMMFVYIQIILSKFNWVEFRLIVGSAGLSCIGMAIIVAFGLCSLIGIPYGPIHASLPFLIMGLGIDDMFVMKACWDQLTKEERELPLPKQIGLMLKHAGVSIVITSFTDVVAFIVGSFTILPSLNGFCFYAAAGVTFVFVFSVTFYVAVFVLDLKRMEEKRNGVILCAKHPDFIPTDRDKKSVSQHVFYLIYSKVVLKTPVKVIMILLTVIVTGFSLEALLKLEQRFDPVWFIPESSYYKQYLNERNLYYPNIGNEGNVFIGAINYTEEFPKIFSMVEKLQSETEIFHSVGTWTTPLRKFILLYFEKDIKKDLLTDMEWRTYLSKFLFSSAGAMYQSKFRFATDLKCGEPTPPISVSSVDFTYKRFPGPNVYLPAMHKGKSIVADANFTTGDKFAILWAKIFGNWVTDEVIAVEVERNLELALLCVMACTIALISNIQMCLWILLCVLLTLVNVCGMMQRWGLTVDVVSCVGLELAVGLCVDYAAHVGHTFLTVEGTRSARALNTVTSIGAAVLYGGGSTLLAISVLSTSDSYIFESFFKIFFLVIAFGLFHGIIFLPIVLSIIGPEAYSSNKTKDADINPEEDAVDSRELEILNSNGKKVIHETQES